jgi:hypothetical protein
VTVSICPHCETEPKIGRREEEKPTAAHCFSSLPYMYLFLTCIGNISTVLGVSGINVKK